MTEGDALMRAILEAPDDDAPRLVYADWLDENGWAAEAGRLRFALANSEGVWWALPAALLHGHCRRGSAELDLPNWARGLAGQAEVSRGFVRSVGPEPEPFLVIAARLFSSQPITSVRLFGPRPKRIFWAGAWGWMSDAETPVPRNHVLPRALYDSLDLTTGARWPTAEMAESQLSRACVRYGRRLAGLPPLDGV